MKLVVLYLVAFYANGQFDKVTGIFQKLEECEAAAARYHPTIDPKVNAFLGAQHECEPFEESVKDFVIFQR
jgi:hypothetical protein